MLAAGGVRFPFMLEEAGMLDIKAALRGNGIHLPA